jgi:hypothetical protein
MPVVLPRYTFNFFRLNPFLLLDISGPISMFSAIYVWKIFYSYLNIKCIGAYSVIVWGKSGLNCDVIGGGFPVFRRRVAPRPGSVLIILSKNIVKNMSVWPAPSPRGHTLAVIANRFLTHYTYAFTHYVIRFAFSPYFTVGSMTYEFLILYAAKFDRWVEGRL